MWSNYFANFRGTGFWSADRFGYFFVFVGAIYINIDCHFTATDYTIFELLILPYYVHEK